jgi:hypothetical protein
VHFFSSNHKAPCRQEALLSGGLEAKFLFSAVKVMEMSAHVSDGCRQCSISCPSMTVNVRLHASLICINGFMMCFDAQRLVVASVIMLETTAASWSFHVGFCNGCLVLPPVVCVLESVRRFCVGENIFNVGRSPQDANRPPHANVREEKGLKNARAGFVGCTIASCGQSF